MISNKNKHVHISTSYNNLPDIEQITFVFDSLPNDVGTLCLKYTGLILNDLLGFYKCTENDKLIMCTQFQPVSARRGPERRPRRTAR